MEIEREIKVTEKISTDKDNNIINTKNYLEKSINTSIGNRKIKKLTIEENGIKYNPRAQQHTLIVSPFGTGKSTIKQEIEDALKGDALSIDDFTLPAFHGTINKRQELVKGIIFGLGGKVFLIDEFNNVSQKAFNSLLSVLENQTFSRKLGFNIYKPEHFKNDYCDIRIEGGLIEGECKFSTIAFGMYFSPNTKKSMALLTRFTPVFLDPSKDDITDLLKGVNKLKIVDNSRIIDEVIVKEQAWSEFIDCINKHLDSKGTYPNEKGFITRASIGALRFAINSILNYDKTSKVIVIDDCKILLEQIPYFDFMLQMFEQPKSVFEQYKQLTIISPNKNSRWYAETLGISMRSAERYSKMLNKEVTTN